MFVLRFKRHKQEHMFLANASRDAEFAYKLVSRFDFAIWYTTKDEAKCAIEHINRIVIPKKPVEFNLSTLFLMQLYGNSWEDSVEGMVLDLEDIVKAQICDYKTLEVLETVRMRCQVWEKHYA
jgi:hypothetical protein